MDSLFSTLYVGMFVNTCLSASLTYKLSGFDLLLVT